MSAKAKILIVEDDMPAAMMMVHMLSRAGCDVSVARTGEKGIQAAQENQFDVITLAVGLPDINGFEICSELKQRHHTRLTPVIFVSGRSCLEDQQHGLDVGALDYITKPFDPSDFVRRLLSHIKTQDRATPRVLSLAMSGEKA